MPYIGNQPAEQFTSFATQEFSTSATTSYTLDHAVTNENEIALFINNVRQQPGSGKAYTATGTALTLSAATASTDTMYCVFLGRALQTVTPATNSITNAMITDSTITSAKLTGVTLGITNAQQWRITSSFTVGTSVTDVDSNWEISDATGYATIGTALTESSGIFSFPTTGIWLIMAYANFRGNAGSRGVGWNLKATTDNSTYGFVSSAEVSNSDFGGSNNTTYHAGAIMGMFDVTDTTQVKFRFTTQATGDTQTCDGDTTRNYTGFTAVRLGDT